MNRGRRRGGGPSLTGLRDGVKRRLFDPHSVPTKPDAKFEVNRLIPFSFPKLPIVSFLNDFLVEADDMETEKELGKYTSHMFNLNAIIEYTYSCGPYHHPMPEHCEGVEMNKICNDRNLLASENRSFGSISLLHLLLAHNEINQWSDNSNLKSLNEPDEWYPEELINLARIKHNVIKFKSYKPSKRFSRNRHQVINDIDEVITDQVIQRVTEIRPENDDEGVDKLDLTNTNNGELEDVGDGEDANSEDARWNGDVDQDADVDNLNDDEFDNDYCQAYFDNGERDFSDDGGGLGGDDDGDGAKYYE